MPSALAEFTARLPVSGSLAADSLARDLAHDIDEGLRLYGAEQTREHVPRVAGVARELAVRFGLDPHQAGQAALLHDIGGIVPRPRMVALCTRLGLPVCAEERQVPMLLHARLSEAIAREVYGVTDAGVLRAIRFHTALHARPTALDLLIFLADKLEWDQGGVPPYHAGLTDALDAGLHAGARFMLEWMWRERARLLVALPDLRAAWAAFGVGEGSA